MDFVTGSKLSFPFTRDIAALARKAVDAAHKSAYPAGAAGSTGRWHSDASMTLTRVS